MNTEFYQEVIGFIQPYDSPEQALHAAQHTPVPRRLKRGKKLLCRTIRKYMHFVNRISK